MTYLPNYIEPVAPWSAMVALREWCVTRAAEIVASGAPDAADYGQLIPRDDSDVWDVAYLAERIADAILIDVSVVDDAWAIGPWWNRRHALVMDAKFPTTAPIFPSAPKVIAATETHEARKDGTYRSHRKRDAIAVGGSGKRTAQGAPVPADMSAIAALLPETGGTAHDAYAASIALQAQGLIPAMLGGEDTMPREMTPALAGNVRIESQRENACTRIKPIAGRTRSLLHEDSCPLKVERAAARKGKRPVDSSIACQCDPTYRMTERVGTTERKPDHRMSTMVRGLPVLASESALPWQRRHIGDAIVIVAPSEDITRTAESRRLMSKGRKVTRYIGGKAKPNRATNAVVTVERREGSTEARTDRADKRKAILELLATLPTEGAQGQWTGWRITCEQEATSRAAARYSAEDKDGATVTDTPRGLATALAAQ